MRRLVVSAMLVALAALGVGEIGADVTAETTENAAVQPGEGLQIYPFH